MLSMPFWVRGHEFWSQYAGENGGEGGFRNLCSGCPYTRALIPLRVLELGEKFNTTALAALLPQPLQLLGWDACTERLLVQNYAPETWKQPLTTENSLTQNGNGPIYQFPGKFQDFCRMSMLTHFCQRPFSLLRRWLFQSLLLKVLFLHKVCTGQVTSGPCLCVNTNLMKPNTLCTVTCGMTVVTVRRGTPGGLVEGHGVKGPTGLSSKGMR